MKKTSRWIKFLGGSSLVFTLGVLIMIGIIVLLFKQVDFIFYPIVVLFSSVLMPAVIALLLYYLLNPIVDFMESKKIKRLWGVSLLYVLILLVIGIIIGTLIPILQGQFESLVENFPSFVETISSTISTWAANLPFGQDFDAIIEQGETFVGDIPNNISEYFSNGLSGVSSVVSSLTNIVVTLITFPLILFFLLKDEKKMSKAVLSAVPPKWREDLLRVSSEINSQVGAYIKGQLIIATSIGVMMFIGFSIIGLDYAIVLALAAGFLSIIPYVGPTLSFIPAFIVAVIDSWQMVFLLILVWMVVQFVDGNLVEPNVMGKQLNVHPLTIIIVLLVVGDLLGIFGLIFGVPMYAIVKVIVVHFFQKYKERYNRYYGDIAGEYEIKSIEDAIRGQDHEDSQFIKNIKKARKNKKKEDERLAEQDDKDSENTDE
ncbi:AI-2E family transporter [Marinilactibacillus kalidii]|uniref:AI-2E family transporter n=1 Tax=Marinilactibacillus kalidii TaxID=2820274 RepID=UPI001FCA1BEE|nr:AI-2E family transporter [Marinilactibacillus kalidii]